MRTSMEDKFGVIEKIFDGKFDSIEKRFDNLENWFQWIPYYKNLNN